VLRALQAGWTANALDAELTAQAERHTSALGKGPSCPPPRAVARVGRLQEDRSTSQEQRGTTS